MEMRVKRMGRRRMVNCGVLLWGRRAMRAVRRVREVERAAGNARLVGAGGKMCGMQGVCGGKWRMRCIGVIRVI